MASSDVQKSVEVEAAVWVQSERDLVAPLAVQYSHPESRIQSTRAHTYDKLTGKFYTPMLQTFPSHLVKLHAI